MINNKILQDYFKKTGQDFKYLMQGAMQYGDDFIINELAAKALKENKKIIWKESLKDGRDVGLLDYELQPL